MIEGEPAHKNRRPKPETEMGEGFADEPEWEA